jgi:hypothetical protein
MEEQVDASRQEDVILVSLVFSMPLAFLRSSRAAVFRLEETFCLIDSMFFWSSLTWNVRNSHVMNLNENTFWIMILSVQLPYLFVINGQTVPQ